MSLIYVKQGDTMAEKELQRCTFFFFLMIRRPPSSPLFPNAALFGSAIAAAAPHRAQAFEACRYVIEGVKQRIPVWKKELRVDGTEVWVDPSGRPTVQPSDHPSHVDRKSTRLNSSHSQISYAVFCLKS